MDKGWKGLPLLVNFLFLSNAYGFRDGAYSNGQHHWGQPSYNMFSPRAVQSSVSEVPVSGNLPEEVGSSLFANRPLKRRLNLLQFVKGHVSSRPQSMSHAQTTPSTSVSASLPLSLNEQHADSLTSQGSPGSSTTDTASFYTQGESTNFPAVLGTSGLSTSNQSPPGLYMSSFQKMQSAQATLPVFSQESLSKSSSSAPGANYISHGSPAPLSEGSGQVISPQGQSSSSSFSRSQGSLSHYTPDSYNKLSSSVSSQSTSDQSTPSLYDSSSRSSLASLLGASGSSFQVDQAQEISNQLLPSPWVSSQSSSQSSPSLFMAGSMSSPYSQLTGPALPLDPQVSFSHRLLSTQTQGSASTSQGSSGPELSGSSYSQSASSSGSQFGGSTGFASQEISNISSGSVQPHGTTSQFATWLPSSYPSVSLFSPQGAASQSSSKQFTSSYGSQSGSSIPLTLQGSTAIGGSLQPQGTTNQFAPGSLSSYPSASIFSPQGASSQSATVQSSRKQFTSTYGTQSGFSTPLTWQGSTTYGGSLQPQGTTSLFTPGHPSSYPSVSISSPQGAASHSSRKQFTSTYGTQSVSSMPLTLQGSTAYGGSLQPQGSTSPFTPGSLSSYPSASISSPQGAASQAALVQSSRKQFTSTYGTQSGFSMPLTLQSSTAYGGSLQPQGTTSQFTPVPPSSYPSVSLSSPQRFASQAFQSYAVAQNQKSQSWPPSEGIQTSGAAVSQGSSASLSSPIQSRLSSLSLAGGSSSGGPGQFASAQGGSTSYSVFSLYSQSPSSKYTSGSHAYAKLGSSPLAIFSQSTSDQSSQGLFSSESRRTPSLLGVVERPSRLSLLAPFDSPSSNQISEHLVTSQHPTGFNQAQSLGLSAQASSIGTFSGIPQTVQALRDSGSDVQLYDQVGSNSQANTYTSSQQFSSSGAQSLPKPPELLHYEPSIDGQGASSVSELLSSYGLTYNQNAPASKPSHSFSSSRYYSVKG